MSEDRREIIKHKRIAKAQKDMQGYCFCGKLKQLHSNVEGIRCRNKKNKSTVVTPVTEKDIRNADFRKI